MAKEKKQYVCNSCGGIQIKWTGQCPDCHAWNTLEETIATSNNNTNTSSRFSNWTGESREVCDASQVSTQEVSRYSTNLSELDRVLGGGLVVGSIVLLGGDPGIGKSTLLAQMIAHLPDNLRGLYISGEESLQQISLRAQRLQLPMEKIRLYSETCVEKILAVTRQENPNVIVIDSVQTIHTELLQSAPGAVAQIRESTAQLVRFAKQTNTTVFIVGHVTKEGALAGPRVLEHMVDTVLYFESEIDSRYRIIRAVKNRFGPANELGVFIMTDKGLRPVSNPSAIFLSRHEESVPGSVIMVTKEGTRPLLVEVQALVDTSRLNMPRRVTLGLEQNRLNMLLAVAHRHGGLAMYDQDVYVNVVGGMRIQETATDLPVLAAIISSFRNAPLPFDLVLFGELGLAGEVRPVPHGQERLKEAAKQGFKYAIIPKPNAPKEKQIDNLEIIAVSRLPEALDALRAL